MQNVLSEDLCQTEFELLIGVQKVNQVIMSMSYRFPMGIWQSDVAELNASGYIRKITKLLFLIIMRKTSKGQVIFGGWAQGSGSDVRQMAFKLKDKLIKL